LAIHTHSKAFIKMPLFHFLTPFSLFFNDFFFLLDKSERRGGISTPTARGWGGFGPSTTGPTGKEKFPPGGMWQGQEMGKSPASQRQRLNLGPAQHTHIHDHHKDIEKV
jgi:hypothetical protein